MWNLKCSETVARSTAILTSRRLHRLFLLQQVFWKVKHGQPGGLQTSGEPRRGFGFGSDIRWRPSGSTGSSLSWCSSTRYAWL